MFRRAIDGVDVRYAVAGLWGSGNVVAPRDELFADRDNYTAYTMWDGHALFGPGRPGTLEKAAVLSAVLSIEEYLDRYGFLGDTCEVWMGDELLGAGCAEACAHLEEVCPDDPFWECQQDCALLPPESVECLQHATGCVADAGCSAEDFVTTSKSSGS